MGRKWPPERDSKTHVNPNTHANKGKYIGGYCPRIDHTDPDLPALCEICERIITPYTKEDLIYINFTTANQSLCHEVCYDATMMGSCEICEQIITPYTPKNVKFSVLGCEHLFIPYSKGKISRE
jgi:hypothetical protein